MASELASAYITVRVNMGTVADDLGRLREQAQSVAQDVGRSFEEMSQKIGQACSAASESLSGMMKDIRSGADALNVAAQGRQTQAVAAAQAVIDTATSQIGSTARQRAAATTIESDISRTASSDASLTAATQAAVAASPAIANVTAQIAQLNAAMSQQGAAAQASVAAINTVTEATKAAYNKRSRAGVEAMRRDKLISDEEAAAAQAAITASAKQGQQTRKQNRAKKEALVEELKAKVAELTRENQDLKAELAKATEEPKAKPRASRKAKKPTATEEVAAAVSTPSVTEQAVKAGETAKKEAAKKRDAALAELEKANDKLKKEEERVDSWQEKIDKRKKDTGKEPLASQKEGLEKAQAAEKIAREMVAAKKSQLDALGGPLGAGLPSAKLAIPVILAAGYQKLAFWVAAAGAAAVANPLLAVGVGAAAVAGVIATTVAVRRFIAAKKEEAKLADAASAKIPAGSKATLDEAAKKSVGMASDSLARKPLSVPLKVTPPPTQEVVASVTAAQANADRALAEGLARSRGMAGRGGYVRISALLGAAGTAVGVAFLAANVAKVTAGFAALASTAGPALAVVGGAAVVAGGFGLAAMAVGRMVVALRNLNAASRPIGTIGGILSGMGGVVMDTARMGVQRFGEAFRMTGRAVTTALPYVAAFGKALFSTSESRAASAAQATANGARTRAQAAMADERVARDHAVAMNQTARILQQQASVPYPMQGSVAAAAAARSAANIANAAHVESMANTNRAMSSSAAAKNAADQAKTESRTADVQRVSAAVRRVYAGATSTAAAANVAFNATLAFSSATAQAARGSIAVMTAGVSVATNALKSGASAAMSFGAGIYNAAQSAALSQFGQTLGNQMRTLVTEFFLANNQFERMRLAFDSLTESTARGGQMMEDMKKFALFTPFKMTELGSNAQLLMTSGFEAENVIPILHRLGDAIALRGTGNPNEVLGRVINIMVKMRSEGKLTALQLNQLGKAGIPGRELIAKEMGVSIPEAMRQITNGTVDAAVGMNALMKMGDDPRFVGGMEKMSKTFSGLASNIGDMFTQTSAIAGKPLFDFVKTQMEDLLAWMMSASGTRLAESISSGTTKALEAIKPVFSAIRSGLPTILSIAAGMGTLSLAMPAVITAMKILAPAIGMVVSALTPMRMLLAGAAYLVTKFFSEPGRFRAISDGLGEAYVWLKRVYGQLGGIGGVVGVAVDAFTGFWDAVASGAVSAWSVVRDRAGEAWDWIKAKAYEVASFIGPIFTTAAATVAVGFMVVKDAADTLVSFVSVNKEATQAILGVAFGVGVLVGVVKMAVAALTFLGVKQIITTGLWAAWTGSVLIAKATLFLFNASYAAFSIIASAATLAVMGFNVALAGTAGIAIVPMLGAVALTAWTVYRAVSAAAGAVMGLYRTGQSAIGVLTDFATLPGGPIGALTGIFAGWWGILKQIVEVAKKDLPLAMEIASAAVEFAVVQMKEVFPGLWKGIQEGAVATWKFIATTFVLEMEAATDKAQAYLKGKSWSAAKSAAEFGILDAPKTVTEFGLVDIPKYVADKYVKFADPTGLSSSILNLFRRKEASTPSPEEKSSDIDAKIKAAKDALAESLKNAGKVVTDDLKTPGSEEFKKAFDRLEALLAKGRDAKVGDKEKDIAQQIKDMIASLGRPAMPKFDPNLESGQKIAYVGFAEMSKKVQEGITGTSMLEFSRRTADATGEVAKHTGATVAKLDLIWDKLEKLKVGLG